VDAIIRLEAAAKTVAHEGGEILDIIRALSAGAAKKLAVQAGVAAGITGHHGGVEIHDPFPGEAVQVMNAVAIRAAGSDGANFRGRRRGIPLEDPAFEFGVVFAVRPCGAGERGVFPFGNGGEAFAF
jgi:hypothetical protein